MLKRRLNMIDLSELWKTCERIIGKAMQERLSLLPLLAVILRKAGILK